VAQFSPSPFRLRAPRHTSRTHTLRLVKNYFRLSTRSIKDSNAAHQPTPQFLTASGLMISTHAPFLKHTYLAFLNSSGTRLYIPLILPIQLTAWANHLRYSTQGCVCVPQSCWMTPSSHRRNCMIRILSSRACDILIILFSTIGGKGRGDDVC
jgi:hypothetical protein